LGPKLYNKYFLLLLIFIGLIACKEEVYKTENYSDYKSCFIGDIEIKTGAIFETYESPYVLDKSQCKSQLISCQNGILDPGYSFFSCQVIESMMTEDKSLYEYVSTSNAGIDFSTIVFNDPISTDSNAVWLFLASAQENKIQVFWPDGNSDNFSVQENTVTTVSVDTKFKIINNMVIENDKVIKITSENPITVYGLNRAPNQTDAYVAIPTINLGTEYYIGTFASQYGSQVIIAASEDNTTINIYPNDYLDNQTLVLEAGESYLYESTGSQDLTGTKVVANKKIGVYAGSTWSEIPTPFIGTGDVLLEQMLPVSSWKDNFLTYPLAGRTGGDTIRIIAKEDNTTVFEDGIQVASLDDQEYWERNDQRNSAKYSSNKPVMLVHYENTLAYDGSVNGDPFIMAVPGIDQYLTSYLFTVPSLSFAEDYANIIVHKDSLKSTKLDGSTINQSLFNSIVGTDYYGATIALNEGSHILTSDSPFGLFVYGTNGVESYGYSGGFNLQ